MTQLEIVLMAMSRNPTNIFVWVAAGNNTNRSIRVSYLEAVKWCVECSKDNNGCVSYFIGDPDVFIGQTPSVYVEKPTRKKSVPTPKAWVEQNPLVEFYYPSSNPNLSAYRKVRVISVDKDYVIGLDTTDKNRFKKFKRSRITSWISRELFSFKA